MSQEAKMDIRRLTMEELTEYFKERDYPAFRARQVYHWLWQKQAKTFEEMTSLSKDLRIRLADEFDIHTIELDTAQYSQDGTIKSRFRLFDDNLIESVLIPVTKDDRYTVCVSTQVGCSLACSFCATGKMKRMRNLSAGEIYDQYVEVNALSLDKYDHPLTNVVYMGMGEPLLNYKETMRSIDLLTEPEGLNISPKRITVSTAGIAKMIQRLADDKVKFNLALSLHAADDKKRNEIMAINETNDLGSLMEAIQSFYKKTGNRISYEYIAFNGFNDTEEDAYNLIQLCQRFPVRVNIIEYNPVEGVPYKKSSADQLDKFAGILVDHGVMTTVRRSRGKDIDAACGQLANKG
ncbi:MAG: 23S rRNA (adenine(2503)-C(2))-methyltransferase RlmN [Saprospiraceae bacterium]|nr:23S rRNA (adenine(2503)-C(2))-methyltransferase RlmN [Saprospiraceae bacterium]